MAVSDLNFQRAEFGPEDPLCTWCTRGLQNNYFSAEDVRICENCARQARERFPADERSVFLRSFALGTLAAAMAGLVFFSLFRMTGGSWMVFASIGVGYIVGKAMRIGSHGVGGRRYQVSAAILTYVSVIVSTTAALLPGRVPVWLYALYPLAPFLMLFLGRASLGGLELLFAFVGIRWAWGQLAGAPLKISGPHPLPHQP